MLLLDHAIVPIPTEGTRRSPIVVVSADWLVTPDDFTEGWTRNELVDAIKMEKIDTRIYILDD
jgi:hypothetical protein